MANEVCMTTTSVCMCAHSHFASHTRHTHMDSRCSASSLCEYVCCLVFAIAARNRAVHAAFAAAASDSDSQHVASLHQFTSILASCSSVDCLNGRELLLIRACPNLFLLSPLSSRRDQLASGAASCQNAEQLYEPNSGILAGIGGSVSLDDVGQEYITSLYFIFHPWPDKITYDISTFKLLRNSKPNQTPVSAYVACAGWCSCDCSCGFSCGCGCGCLSHA